MSRSGNGRDGSGFASIEDAIRDVARGRFVIVVDDEDRENEGDLTLAAEKVTPESINFMARYGRGLICMPMTEDRLEELDIPLMVKDNTSPYNTAFCVSIEAKRNVSTGISASDRAHTVKVAIDSRTRPVDLTRPGHMFPLRAQKGDRKSTRLNSSHGYISYAVFCLKKKNNTLQSLTAYRWLTTPT